jgi:hypothetical protein
VKSVRLARGRTGQCLAGLRDHGLDDGARGRDPARSLGSSPNRVYPDRQSRIQRPSATWTVYRLPRTVIGVPSTPWVAACEPRAGERGHQEGTSLEQNLGAPMRHPPPPPAWAPSIAACDCESAPCACPVPLRALQGIRVKGDEDDAFQTSVDRTTEVISC